MDIGELNLILNLSDSLPDWQWFQPTRQSEMAKRIKILTSHFVKNVSLCDQVDIRYFKKLLKCSNFIT